MCQLLSPSAVCLLPNKQSPIPRFPFQKLFIFVSFFASSKSEQFNEMWTAAVAASLLLFAIPLLCLSFQFSLSTPSPCPITLLCICILNSIPASVTAISTSFSSTNFCRSHFMTSHPASVFEVSFLSNLQSASRAFYNFVSSSKERGKAIFSTLYSFSFTFSFPLFFACIKSSRAVFCVSFRLLHLCSWVKSEMTHKSFPSQLGSPLFC